MSWGILVATILSGIAMIFFMYMYWVTKEKIKDSTVFYENIWKDFLHQQQGWLYFTAIFITGCLFTAGLILMIF